MQFSEAVCNARLDSIELTIGTRALIRIYEGPPPASCADDDTGATVLVTYLAAVDWMANAANGRKDKSGAWPSLFGVTGVPGHFRVRDRFGEQVHMQGTCSGIGGGGDMELAGGAVVDGTAYKVTKFTIFDNHL